MPTTIPTACDHYCWRWLASRMGLDVDIAAAENLLTALFNEEIGFVAQVDTRG